MRLPEIHRYGQVFNFVADNIRCWADAEGAQVFPVNIQWDCVFPFQITVLAHTKPQAEEKAKEYDQRYFDPEDEEDDDLDNLEDINDES